MAESDVNSFYQNKENLLKNIKDGVITTELNKEMMKKHLFETWDKKSSFFKAKYNEVQKIIKEKSGSGIVYEKQYGKQYKEIIEVDEEIAYNVNEDDSSVIEKTNRAVIHYSKNRTHITPISRKKRSKK